MITYYFFLYGLKLICYIIMIDYNVLIIENTRNHFETIDNY